MDAASLFKQSTPFRRLAVASLAGVLLAVTLATVGRSVPAALDGLLSDLTQRSANTRLETVHVVTLPGTTGLSRSDLARLQDRLVRAGAAAVVLQTPLDTPEAPRDLAQVRGMLDALGANRDPALVARLDNWARELDHDGRLEQSLRATRRTVLAAMPVQAAPGETSAQTGALTPLPGIKAANAPAMPAAGLPLQRFTEVAIGAVLAPARIDGDGVRRHEALYFDAPAGPVPSVELGAWLMANDIAPEQLAGDGSSLGTDAATLALAGDAIWLPRYGNTQALARSTAGAWLDSATPPADIRGRVAVVCPRLPTEANPVGRNVSQCDGTALRIASLLAGDYLLAPAWGLALTALLWLGVIAFAALAAPLLPTGGRIAVGSGLAIGIAGLELWLQADHNTAAPLMSAAIALAILTPWVWRIRVPERPVAESILATDAIPFAAPRGAARRAAAEPRAAATPRGTTPPPVATVAMAPRDAAARAVEAARSSRLGVELDHGHVHGQGLPGVESVPQVGTERPHTGSPAKPAAHQPPARTGETSAPAITPGAVPGTTSLREISAQLSARMVDPATTDVADLLLGRIKRPPKPRLGRYELDRELGRGAMGTVYVARDPQINRVVALKAIPLSDEANEQDANDLRTRFFREAEMAGRLAHPRIVTVYDAGEDRGIAYIAMEFLQGRTLGDFTSADRRLPDDVVFEVMARVAEGLDYAHRQGVIHRDIKPGNIIYDVETGATKITDFGIARVTNSASTRTGVVLGTPSFMSPEQLEGKPLQGTSDLFSLGITLFQLLTGQLPFRADSMTALMDKIANAPHPALEALRPDLPPAAALVLDHALEKDPSRRFQSGAEMADALRHCAALLTGGTAAPPTGDSHV